MDKVRQILSGLDKQELLMLRADAVAFQEHRLGESNPFPMPVEEMIIEIEAELDERFDCRDYVTA
jgi:hypothetical protein